MSAPSGRWGPCCSTAPMGRRTTGFLPRREKPSNDCGLTSKAYVPCQYRVEVSLHSEIPTGIARSDGCGRKRNALWSYVASDQAHSVSPVPIAKDETSDGCSTSATSKRESFRPWTRPVPEGSARPRPIRCVASYGWRYSETPAILSSPRTRGARGSDTLMTKRGSIRRNVTRYARLPMKRAANTRSPEARPAKLPRGFSRESKVYTPALVCWPSGPHWPRVVATRRYPPDSSMENWFRIVPGTRALQTYWTLPPSTATLWTVLVSATTLPSEVDSHSTPATYTFVGDMYNWYAPRVRNDSKDGGSTVLRFTLRTRVSALEPAESEK